MTELLNINEIKNDFQYRDLRSVIRWCKNNNVHILSYVGTYKKFVLKDEYEKAKMETVIGYVRNKYGEEALYKIFNPETIFFGSGEKINITTDKTYVPQGQHESEIWSILQNLNRELPCADAENKTVKCSNR